MTIEERLARQEAKHGAFQEITSSLRDALIVTSAIQQRQAGIQKTQAESIAHLLQAVDELAQKLNGLIGYRGDPNPPKQ